MRRQKKRAKKSGSPRPSRFSLKAYTKSRVADRLGIDNTPPPEVIPRLKALHRNIFVPIEMGFLKEKIKKKYHFKSPVIASAYRCLELNRALKSKDTSQHVRGEAMDIEIMGFSNKGLFEFCKTLDYDQLILEYYTPGRPQSGWIHISYVSRKKNRHQAFSIGGKK